MYVCIYIYICIYVYIHTYIYVYIPQVHDTDRIRDHARRARPALPRPERLRAAMGGVGALASRGRLVGRVEGQGLGE